jgi:hypothetical protein
MNDNRTTFSGAGTSFKANPNHDRTGCSNCGSVRENPNHEYCNACQNPTPYAEVQNVISKREAEKQRVLEQARAAVAAKRAASDAADEAFYATLDNAPICYADPESGEPVLPEPVTTYIGAPTAWQRAEEEADKAAHWAAVGNAPKLYGIDPKFAYAQVDYKADSGNFPWAVQISFYENPKQGEPNSTWRVGTFESLGDALTNVSNTIRARQLHHCDIEVNSKGQRPAGTPQRQDGWQLNG